MTTMSMTGALSDNSTGWFKPASRSAKPTPAPRVPVPRVADANVDASPWDASPWDASPWDASPWEASPWEACLDSVLEVSGGLALALVPFATLAWMFVAW